jgi:hypothetical protein
MTGSKHCKRYAHSSGWLAGTYASRDQGQQTQIYFSETKKFVKQTSNFLAFHIPFTQNREIKGKTKKIK